MHGRRTKILKLLLFVFLIPILIGCIVLWLAGREMALQVAIDQLVARSGGALKITGAKGGIYQGMNFDRLEWRGPHQIIVLENGILMWEPSMLLSNTLLVTQAKVKKITVDIISESPEPAPEPATLEIAVDLVAPSVQVDSVEIKRNGETIVLTAVDLAGRYGDKKWQVERLRLGTPWGAATARGRLGAVRPFAADGEVRLIQERGEPPYRVEAALNGALADLGIAAVFSVKDIPGKANARITPFNSQPWSSAELDVQRLSPQKWNAGWPSADLNLHATLTPGAGARFKGKVQLRNNASGPIDRELIPLAALNMGFDGDMKALDLSDIEIDLGEGGIFRGTGSWHDNKAADAVTLKLTTQNLNLKGLHSKLKATRIRGDIGIASKGETWQITTALSESKLAIQLQADGDRNVARISKAELRAGAGKLSLSGEAGLTDKRAFTLVGNLAAFNPRDFGDYPDADINGDIKADGTLASPWLARVDLVLKPSRITGRAFAGKARMAVSADALRDVDVALIFGANQITARGNFGSGDGKPGRADDNLVWNIAAPKLSDLGDDFAGQLTAAGEASGTFAAPAVQFSVDGKDLKLFAAHRIKTLRGQGRVDVNKAAGKSNAASNITVDAGLAVTDYQSGNLKFTSAGAKLSGNRGSHVLSASLTNTDINVSAEARGALAADNLWRGEITRLDNRGRVPFTLKSAATLVAGAKHIELGKTVFDVGGGMLEVDHLRALKGELSTRGRAAGLPLSLAVSFSEELKKQIDTNLRLGAEWDITAGAAANGKLRIFRESGDLQFLTEPRFAAGLDQLAIEAEIADNRINALLDANGTALGRVRFAAATRVEKRDQVWGIPGEAQIDLKGDIDVTSLRWVPRLVAQPGMTLDGRLRAQLTANGTFADPRLQGRANGSALALTWPEQGLGYKDGEFDAEFSGDNIVVKRLAMKAGGGRLDADGTLRLSGIKSSGKLNVKIENFEAVSRPDRQVVATGQGTLQLDENRVTVGATLKADRGFIELPDKTGPTISDDIVIVGKTEEAESKERKMATRVDIKLDLGENFKVRGAGIDGKLAGTLQVVSSGPGLPRAVGTLRVENGTYAVYGQKLALERGILTFSGPIDNPGINLLALRKNQAVEAGVEVRGSVIAPQARLVSTPNVPETEKLSWLVLGRGLENSSKADFSLLSAAASGLLGSNQSASLQARIANSLGIDEFGISPPGGGEGGLLTVGKRLSSRVYITYEQGLGKVSNLLKIRYIFSKKWSVQAQAGTESAVDAFYTLSFD